MLVVSLGIGSQAAAQSDPPAQRMLAPPGVYAQMRSTGGASNLPRTVSDSARSKVAIARERQAAAAERSEVRAEITIGPRETRGGIVGIPKEMRDLRVRDKRDIEDFRELLADLLGFIGTESLVASQVHNFSSVVRYTFGQEINRIPVHSSDQLNVYVDPETQLITDLRGSVIIDTGYPTQPNLTASEAKAAALRAQDNPGLYYPVGGEGHTAQLIYMPSEEGVELVWFVGLEARDAATTLTGGPLNHFYVRPDGSVDDGVLSLPTTPVRVCDGNQQNGSVSCNQPVIDTNGDCSDGYNCSLSKYQTPRAAAIKTGGMIDDVTGQATNLGFPNGFGGSSLDVHVDVPIAGQDTLAVYKTVTYSYGGYAAIQHGDGSNGTTPQPNNPIVTHHEAGHAFYKLKNPGAFEKAASNGALLNTLEEMETNTIAEAVSEITAVLAHNYRGAASPPPFAEVSFDWSVGTTATFISQASVPVDLSKDPHENASIVGHMFYELAKDLSISSAATLFFNSIRLIRDDDFGLYSGNGEITFDELRQAMLEEAGSDQSLVYAIKNAWGSVGVDDQTDGASTGQPAPPVGNPDLYVSWVTGDSVSCSNGVSTHSLDWAAPSSAEYYIVYVDLGSGFGYNATRLVPYGFATTNALSARWEVAACSNSLAACGALSPTYYQVNNCD